MLMKLIIAGDDGTFIHEVHSSIMNGVFNITFDQGFVPKDETGELLKVEIGFHFFYSDAALEDAINSTLEEADVIDATFTDAEDGGPSLDEQSRLDTDDGGTLEPVK